MRFASVTLSALLFAGAAFAQQAAPQKGAGARGAGLQALKTYLNLTDQQVTDLKAVETSLHTAIQPLRQDLVAKRQDLRAELQKTTPDQSIIAQLNQQIASDVSQIEAQRATFQKQLLAVLTADQISQLNNLSQALQLVPAARAAAALDLINAPEGFGGLRAPAGRARGMMRRAPAQ